ncbi:uncharacterized protein LOC127718405 isoform X2 [Mytilus californianus]|uniref:uncharacterized protein LOC127718405 isoform X2 n=1 Tax=Mytilus californianus TaxID=6549 RepID=UPI0022451BE4|nr:uncharacterized protein LOC127718405 isoform X2 [Mytilus californianus]
MTQQLNMLSVLLIHTTVMLTATAQQNLTPFGTASQSSSYDSNDPSKGKPENAVNPPISNKYSLDNCSNTKQSYTGISEAWWMFEFSFNTAYITDITIYYRENYAYRMDGFKLYVTNTSTIPPDGYLCYEDPNHFRPPYPDIHQTIPCNQLGKYVIYYDDKGSDEVNVIYEPIVELCYVAINGCLKGTWGTNCLDACPLKCIDQHCYPENGSCTWGCDPQKCLNNNCDKHTGACSEGCVTGLAGQFCNMKYKLIWI